MIRNRHTAICCICHKRVAVEDGYLRRVGGGWVCRHITCAPKQWREAEETYNANVRRQMAGRYDKDMD